MEGVHLESPPLCPDDEMRRLPAIWAHPEAAAELPHCRLEEIRVLRSHCRGHAQTHGTKAHTEPSVRSSGAQHFSGAKGICLPKL